MLAAALMLSLVYTSCDELEGLFDGDKESADQAFLPKSYEGKTVAAWYARTDKSDDKVKTTAVFLFTDKTFVVTKSKVYDDESKNERKIEAEGTYTFLEGDYDNGKAIAEVNDGGLMTIMIEKGKLTNVDVNEVFKKQDNNKVPKAQDPVDGDGGGQGGDSDYIGDVQPYLPAEFGGNTIGAWYLFVDEQDSKIQLESVFLFDDGSLVVTKSKFYTVADGREPEYAINATGKYRLTEGDYESGIASVVLSDGETFEVKISNGELFAMNTLFTKQKNEAAPAPLKL